MHAWEAGVSGFWGRTGPGKPHCSIRSWGFYRPSSGKACIFGHDIAKEGKTVRRMVGYMPERDAFIAGMSGVRFVRMMAELSGLTKEDALERAHEVFFYVGLGEARYRGLETYSLGMKQLAKLAQAIVHGPRLIFLDEPTNGLDPPARSRMLKLVREIRDKSGAHIIMCSHLLPDVEACCDEVLVLKDGRIANLLQPRRGAGFEQKVLVHGGARRTGEVRARPQSPRRAKSALRTGAASGWSCRKTWTCKRSSSWRTV